MTMHRITIPLLGLAALAGPLAAQDSSRACLEPEAAMAQNGEALFTSRGCIGCHTIGAGVRIGPDLAGATARRELDWLRRFIKTPSSLLDSDSAAQALLAQSGGVRMPDLRLTDEEVEALLHYITRESRTAGAAANGGAKAVTCSGR
ncbi:MAG: c-type cytochrome [Gemmatimonadales bacterium]